MTDPAHRAWEQAARRLLAASGSEVRAQGVLHSHLDLCTTLLEFERVTGEGFGCREVLGECAELLRGSRGLVPWLFGGAAHFGWAALRYCELAGRRPPVLDAIDAVVLRWAEEYPDDLDVDLPRGILGLGVYGLVHPDATVRGAVVGAVLDVVFRRVEHVGDDAFVRLVATSHRRATAPSEIGHRDLGMAHGNAGVQAFLAAAAHVGGPVGARAAALLPKVFRWMSRQRCLAGSAVFPQSVETRYRASRSAWCYGNPGVALSMLMAAEVFPRGSAEADLAGNLAGQAARAVLGRGAAEHGVHDGCLCHGSAGLAYFALRMEEAWPGTGWAGFAGEWCDRLVDDAAAGPLTYLFPPGRAPNRSWLEGDLGVAAVLLYAARGVRPQWEELLLTAPPGAGRQADRLQVAGSLG